MTEYLDIPDFLRNQDNLKAEKKLNAKPILFNSEMVRALLDGRKTQTRRIIKNPEYHGCLTGDCPHSNKKECDQSLVEFAKECPVGQVGDYLYVRETFRDMKNGNACYRATVKVLRSIKWTPSIHMPRWASRLTLKITDVRVERVQDISEEDSIAEGCYTNEQYTDKSGEENVWPCRRCNGYQVHGAVGENMGWTEVDCVLCDTAKKRFKQLWDSLNDNWNENPYVWVITFSVIHHNVDVVIEADKIF